MAKTNNPNGRPKGTPNVMTKELRQRLKVIVETELDSLPAYLDELDSRQRMEALFRLMPYVLPKVEAVSLTDGEPFQLDPL